jgi:Tol biopolymer transport system component
MKRFVRFVAAFAASALSVATANAAPLLGPPRIFAPGVISGAANDGAPTVSPDGKTLLFTRSGAGAGAILESHLIAGRWSPPRIASFSGTWNDQHAAFSPDGRYVVYVSIRRVGHTKTAYAHLYRVDRTASGWTAPALLPVAVNIGPAIFKPSVAADGSIYFLSIGTGHKLQMYRSSRRDGTYLAARRLPFSVEANADVDPEIAPDQSFLVLASSGRSSKDDAKEHLFIVFNRGGSWGAVQRIRYAGDDANGSSNDNEPDLGPDGRTLYFSSDRSPALHFPRSRAQALADEARIEAWDNGSTNVWTLDIGALVKNARRAG